MDPAEITKKLQLIQSALSKLLTTQDEKIARYVKKVSDMELVAEDLMKYSEDLRIELEATRKECQDLQKAHQEQLKQLESEAKKSAALTIFQSKIQMYEEAKAEGFEDKSWDVRKWKGVVAKLGGQAEVPEAKGEKMEEVEAYKVDEDLEDEAAGGEGEKE
ncbi:hypothetical protein Hanom_Chr02g00122321 [Helianthus anomalus]